MAPPKGFKKGYVKDPDTDEWVKPKKKVAVIPAIPIDKKADKVVDQLVSRKQKDDLGPVTKSIRDDREYAKVIISWKSSNGRLMTTQYVMADLVIDESIHEEFSGAKKQIRIDLNINGAVLEKI